jgi:DNA-damage-inducible protein D
MIMNQIPDFDSIKQVNPYGEEYWSARSLMLKLGYKRWDYFIKAIQDAIHNLQTNEQIPENHISYIRKKVPLGSGAEREIDDYYLSRFGCYLIAMNGDPRKPEIAAAQVYFAVTTRAHEIHQLRMEQEQRLETRLRVSESFKQLASAASVAGVLSKNFGLFVDACYLGLHHATIRK